MALMGYSYGGEMAGFVEGKTDRFKAIISGAPVIDQFSEYGTEVAPGMTAGTSASPGSTWPTPGSKAPSLALRMPKHHSCFCKAKATPLIRRASLRRCIARSVRRACLSKW